MLRAWQNLDGASKAAPVSARGCTGSPPTCASTCTARPTPGPAHGDGPGLAPGRVVPRPPCCPKPCWVTPIPDARAGCRSTPTRPRSPSTANRPAGLRHRAAAPPGPPARRLILCEVLRWQASEVAELLGHQRARGQQRPAAGPRHARRGPRRPAAGPLAGHADLLDRYVDAFERYDIALVTLLHDDAVQSMPPFAMWVQGATEHRPLDGRAGSERLPGLAPGAHVGQRLPAAFGQYRPDPAGGHRPPWAL
jgi:RNA polymerase sigma-70 factor (ECF subfamily)